jgi:HK97 gp10 family phage protein
MKRKIDLHLDAAGILAAADQGASEGLRLGAELVSVQAKTNAPKRTGQLANSVQAEPPTGQFTAGSLSASVGAGAPYSAFVEFGTKPHIIRAKNKKVLRFPGAGGGFRFATQVHHPGTKAQPYLQPAVDGLADDVAEVIAEAIDDALNGLGGA